MLNKLKQHVHIVLEVLPIQTWLKDHPFQDVENLMRLVRKEPSQIGFLLAALGQPRPEEDGNSKLSHELDVSLDLLGSSVLEKWLLSEMREILQLLVSLLKIGQVDHLFP
jgi:hypothetical protein